LGRIKIKNSERIRVPISKEKMKEKGRDARAELGSFEESWRENTTETEK
jgi:hypothetical protein